MTNTDLIAKLLQLNTSEAIRLWQEMKEVACIPLSTYEVLTMLQLARLRESSPFRPDELCAQFGVLRNPQPNACITISEHQAAFFQRLHPSKQLALVCTSLSQRLTVLWPLMQDKTKQAVLARCLEGDRNVAVGISHGEDTFLSTLSQETLLAVAWNLGPPSLEKMWRFLNNAARQSLLERCVNEQQYVGSTLSLCSAEILRGLSSGTQIDLAWQLGPDAWPQTLRNIATDTKRMLAARCLKTRTHIPALFSTAPRQFWSDTGAVLQTDLVWHLTDAEIHDHWHTLLAPSRVFVLYRCHAEANRFGLFLDLTSNEIQFQMIQKLSNAPLNNPLRAFVETHNTFQNYVIEVAWANPEPLDLSPLLPLCSFAAGSGVRYCEGRPWPTDDDRQAHTAKASRAFCPRTGRECSLATPNDVEGARIYADLRLPWQNWSLAEVLVAKGITASLKELRNSNEYVPRLSGWINRLNDLRERLKCSVCQSVMRPNYTYAKNLARYNVTVVSCAYGEGHDQNVYLNHCWGCAQIIDRGRIWGQTLIIIIKLDWKI